MHLADLNWGDLLLSLWRGTIKGATKSDPKDAPYAVLQGEVWSDHGKRVARARSHLPGFLDRVPRDVSENINSGFKAVEWHTYLYGYLVSMLRHILPRDAWQQLCKHVKGVRLMYQEEITNKDVVKAKVLLTESTVDFENVYYHRDPDLLHVVRPCVHSIWHAPDEIFTRGSLIGLTQHTMERFIGDLGGQIRQPSNPYANLAQRAVRRCRDNALRAMLPGIGGRSIDDTPALPRGSYDLGDNYALLCARDTKLTLLSPGSQDTQAFYNYLSSSQPASIVSYTPANFSIMVRKWSRLRLPVEQVARSAWKECRIPLSNIRIARCVKIAIDGGYRMGEVRYFVLTLGNTIRPVALVSLFGPCDHELYVDSHETIERHAYQGEAELRVVDVKSIKLVVAMIPDEEEPPEEDPLTDYQHFHVGRHYVVLEKLRIQLGVQGHDPEMDIHDDSE
ncbi:hypothetical protein C8Q80DRAFT_1109289 [Daedaleopsis nitida]|nr:hypothetical protein C8Q80DRAFT_1109289 [Daedaleopsis nitida]